jgi:hypothetical protein
MSNEIPKLIFGRFADGYKDYLITRDGRVYSIKSKKFLRPQFNSKKYLRVRLCKNGKPLHFFVHRLVAECYCENNDPLRNWQVDHRDRDKTNNAFTNLAYVSPKENVLRSRNSFMIKYLKPRYDHEASKIVAGTPF